VAALDPQAIPPADAAGRDRTPEILALLAAWEGSWEGKDLDAFFSYYADDFYFPDRKMKFAAFRTYRGGLIQKAGTIAVETENPKVKVDGDTATLTFTQKYRSDEYRDAGTKTLTLKYRDGAWKITSETFKARS
jgi:ketosteroid isomerase-like protein